MRAPEVLAEVQAVVHTRALLQAPTDPGAQDAAQADTLAPTEAAGEPTGGVAAQLDGVLEAEGLPSVIRAVLIAIIGFPAVLLLSRALGRWLRKRYSAQQGLVGEKILFYVGIGILAVTLLQELGFSLAPLLGAAGIVGIALGFASQTSVSNIISGFFLMAEQPFRVGDVIRVGQTAGVVLSVDMMSVKLRTFNNEFVRIPNESLIKTEVTTVTRFPIRRLEVPVGVAYKEDVERVRKILLEIADQNPLSLIEPEPVVRLERFGNSSIDLTLALWTAKQNFLSLKTRIQEEIKARLDSEGIEIPFPHQSMYAGSATEPFPIRLVSDEEWRERLAEEGGGASGGAGESGEEEGESK